MMKKFLRIFAVVILTLTSCVNEDFGSGDKAETPTSYDIVVSPSQLQFEFEGGEKEVVIESEVSYELLCEATWVTYKRSDVGVAVVVEENVVEESRKALLVVYNRDYEIYRSVAIEQNGYVAPVEPGEPSDPWNPEITDPAYDRMWAEQPEKVENNHYIHKTYYTTLKDGKRVRNFSVCYDAVKMCSRWVAYPGHTVYRQKGSYQVGENNNSGRTNAWAFDDAVTKYAPSADYNSAYEIVSKYDSKTGAYDTAKEPIIPHRRQADICFNNGFGWGWARGHMLPSSQRYNTWETNAQTCYATNIMVQQYDFNGGSWASVESIERNKNCSDTLYVVVGTLFEKNQTTTRFGRTIGIPSHCYKLLLRTKSGSSRKAISEITSADEIICIGFLFENSEASVNVSAKSAATSVAEIEKRAGFKFFRNLNPAIADEVQSQKRTSDWEI